MNFFFSISLNGEVSLCEKYINSIFFFQNKKHQIMKAALFILVGLLATTLIVGRSVDKSPVCLRAGDAVSTKTISQHKHMDRDVI